MHVGRRWVLAAGAVCAAVYPLLGFAGRSALFVIVPFAAIAILSAGVIRGRLRPTGAWVLLACGQAGFMTGDLLWQYFEAVGLDPFPSIADAFYLSGYPLLAAGLAHLLRSRSAQADHDTVIDAAILSIGGATAVWVLFVAPMAADATVPLLDRSVTGAYLLFDMLLLGLLARIALGPDGRAPSVLLLGGSLLSLLGADFLFSIAQMRQLDGLIVVADVGYLAAYVLVAAAALHPSAPRPVTPTPEAQPVLSRSRLALLAAASLLTPLILAWQTLFSTVDGIPLSLSAALLSLLVISRMRGLVRKIEEHAQKLAAQAMIDPLTGLGNRRAWDEWVPLERDRAKRNGQPLCVVMLDLDRFKSYNDRHGHVAGDMFLKAMAAAWQEEIRSVDLLARYGGEEFGLVLPGCGPRKALEIIERLRAAIPEGESCSAGLVQWDGAESAMELVQRADRVLYEAKRQGRGRTVIADSSAAPAP